MLLFFSFSLVVLLRLLSELLAPDWPPIGAPLPLLGTVGLLLLLLTLLLLFVLLVLDRLGLAGTGRFIEEDPPGRVCELLLFGTALPAPELPLFAAPLSLLPLSRSFE